MYLYVLKYSHLLSTTTDLNNFCECVNETMVHETLKKFCCATTRTKRVANTLQCNRQKYAISFVNKKLKKKYS